MNTAQITSLPTPFVTNIALAEVADFVRNEASIHSFEDAARQHASAASVMREELWPFTVKIVSTPEQLAKAIKLRHDAYAKHLPDVAAKLLEPEEADHLDIVLLAESKFDGSALGTMRIRTNDASPLQIEGVLEMPAAMRGRRLAEATRLAIKGSGGSRMVRDAMFKAFFTVCEQMGVDYMVITARKPVDRIYEWLDFKDIGAEGEFIALPYVGGLPHRVLTSHVPTIHSRWAEMDHPLCDFFWNTKHPDMRVQMPDSRTNLQLAQMLRFA
jgi:hypothetical protein